MSGKTDRRIRKEMNRIEESIRIKRQNVADECVLQLLNAPFKYRFLFALKILFRRKLKGKK